MTIKTGDRVKSDNNAFGVIYRVIAMAGAKAWIRTEGPGEEWDYITNVNQLTVIPDTVTVEISRDLAEWYAADNEVQLRGNMHLGKPPNTLMREASRKALGHE